MKRDCELAVFFLIFAVLAFNANAVTVSVDWSSTLSTSTNLLYGTNEYSLLDGSPKQTTLNQNYASLMYQNNFRFIRFHRGDLNGWINPTTKTWVKSIVLDTYALYSTGYKGSLPTIIQNIPGWPDWMLQSNGRLDPSAYDAYASYCADLVRIVNIDGNYKVKYWEPINEKEDLYSSNLGELWTIYNKCAVAMKAVDPTIQIGGPALTWANTGVTTSFLNACGTNVNFISWHCYLTGDGSMSNVEIFNKTYYIGSAAAQMKAHAQSVSGRSIPVFLTEYNINWDYAAETRQNQPIGAVWFASVMINLANAKVDGGMQWNSRNYYYGLFNDDNTKRLSATVYKWFNDYFVGTVVNNNRVNVPWTMLEALSVKQTNGNYSVALVNKLSTSTSVTLSLSGEDFAPTMVVEMINGATGYSTSTKNVVDALSIPAYSLAFLRLTRAPSVPKGLTGNYYSKANFNQLVLKRVDATVNFNWATGSPSTSVPTNNFSVRWTGFVKPLYSQLYTFYGTADDGVRLYVNNVLVINGWTDAAATERSGTISLVAGQKYSVKLEYYDAWGEAVIQLRWSSASQAKEIIPQAQLFSA